MKKLIFAIAIIFLTQRGLAAPASINSPVNGTGWSFNQHNPGGYYAGIDNANDGYSWDINYGSGWDDEGMPVYAVEDGCFYTSGGWGGTTYNQILLNHTTNDENWSSGYLHMKNIVNRSGCVKKGDKLGEISRTGYLANPNITSPHLHFAIYNSHGKSGLNSTNAVLNSVTYPLLSDSLPASSYFDGAGSLIDPNNGGSCAAQGYYGCSKDKAVMHPHAIPSTVVFQVNKVAGKCESVNVTGLLGAYITVKQWSEGFPGSLGNGVNSTVYRSVFPAQIPLADGTWSLISVTSLSPVPSGETRSVEMTCQPGSVNASTNTDIAPALSNRGAQLDAVIPKFDSGHYWGGNGSLISFSNNQTSVDTQQGYGRNRDFAKKFITLPSKSLFQTFTNGTLCKNILIKRKDSRAMPVTLQWKSWMAPGWTGMNVSLPYTLTLTNGYNIVTIDSLSDSSDTYIFAECV